MICQKLLAHGLCSRNLFYLAIVAFILPAVAYGQTTTVNVGTNTGTNTGLPIYYREVGGVAIDTEGILENVRPDALGKLAKIRREALQPAPAGLDALTDLRKVSLRRLEAAIQQCAKTGQPLPDDIRFLGGLQQIRYVFVYPEQKDIVLAGPGEGWKVDERGSIVGLTTGRPVMLLDDLLVALRSAQAAAQGGIRCSIDPTAEGLTRLRSYVSTLKNINNPQATMSEIEETLGMQQIMVAGVPANSHFAQVLVAADYRMKRLAMNFDPAPKGIKLPSFLQMVTVSGRGMSNMLPRWWLEPRYEPILRDGDGLAWELRCTGVKALTEEDFLTSSGSREHTGKANLMAQKWADNMTNQYAALSVAEPIFGELQNCMDLAVVAALIVKEKLTDKAGNSMPVLMDTSDLRTAEFNVPKQVPSRASVLERSRNWVISASGGVAINSWGIADKTQQSDAVAPARAKAAPKDDSKWWWN
jgi:hypothetical protein